jgi:hypothetical protein
LNRASQLREHRTCVRANRVHHTNYDDQDHCQHDRVLNHILTFCVEPKLLEEPNFDHSDYEFSGADLETYFLAGKEKCFGTRMAGDNITGFVSRRYAA